MDGGYVLTIPHEAVNAEDTLHITTSRTADHPATLAIGSHDDQCIQIASSANGH